MSIVGNVGDASHGMFNEQHHWLPFFGCSGCSKKVAKKAGGLVSHLGLGLVTMKVSR